MNLTQTAKTMTNNRSNIYTPMLLVALLVLGTILSGCTGADGASGPEGTGPAAADSRQYTRVETLVLEPTSFEDVIELTGTVKATEDATLSAQSSGTVVMLAELGDYVRAGQVVAQLDPKMAQAAVEQAQANVEAAEAQYALAQDNFRRQEPLFRDSIISAIEFENVRAQYNQAQAQLSQARAGLAQAQKQLENTTVNTPFSGTVEERFVERGEQVMPGTPIARVVSSGRVKITAGVPERYASEIEIGTPVRIGLKAYGGEQRTGRVTFVGSTINPDNRTFTIEVELNNNGYQLKPQMVTQLYVIREQLEDVLVVPRAAVLRDENGTGVYVVHRQGEHATAEHREVTLGPSYGSDVVIQSGVSRDEEVVVVGQTNLTEDDTVQVVEQHLSGEQQEMIPDAETVASGEAQ